LGGNHPIDWVSLFPFRAQFNLEGKDCDGIPETKGPIIIGNDVWIGTGVTIMSGVTIGNGAVIAGNSVVTKNVDSFSIVGGVPAKEIKKRFSQEIVSSLENIEWWDWELKKIKENIGLLSSNNINDFIHKHKKK